MTILEEFSERIAKILLQTPDIKLCEHKIESVLKDLRVAVIQREEQILGESNMTKLTDEFLTYIEDIILQNLDEKTRKEKLNSVLQKLENTAVRIASSTLLPEDLDLSCLSNDDLADKMQMHVMNRSSHQTIRLPNSAWSMMLEAAKRLRVLESQLISIFDENGYPEYIQGRPTNELVELANAEQLNFMVREFVIPELKKRNLLPNI